MRHVVIVIFSFLSFSTSCQTFEFFAGPNFNMAHKAFKAHLYDSARVDPGISLAVQKGFQFKNRNMEWAASYSFYSGRYSNGYHSGVDAHHAFGYYQNHAFSIELYPLVLGKKHFNFSAGIVASYRFLSNNKLHVSNWHNYTSGSLTALYDVSELGTEYGSNIIAGLQLNFTRYFIVSPATSIILRAQVYQGLTGDYLLYGDKIFRTAVTPQIGLRKTF